MKRAFHVMSIDLSFNSIFTSPLGVLAHGPEFKEISVHVLFSLFSLPSYFTDLLQPSGEWYTILLASNIKEGIEENGVMRGFVHYIQGWDNSSLSFKFHVK